MRQEVTVRPARSVLDPASMTDSPSPDSPEQPARRLGTWERAGLGWIRIGAGLGIAQYAIFAGFAFCAASALAALVEGRPFAGWLAAAAGLALVRALLQAGETRAGIEASLLIRDHVRRQAARALCARGPAFTERHETGAISAALIDAVEKLEGYFARYRPLLPVLAGGPLVLVLAAAAASPVVAAGLLLSAPVFIAVTAIVGAGAAEASRDQLATLRRLAGRFNDRLQALETLNAFNAAGREAAGLARAADELRRRTMKVLRIAFLSSAALEIVSAFAIAATAIYAGLTLMDVIALGPDRDLALRGAVFLLLLAPEFYTPMRRFSAAYHDRADAEAAAEALDPILDGPGMSASPPAAGFATAPQIRFEAVSSVYPDGRRGLDTLSFCAPAGQITGLWGPSGAGKSTALKLLMGYAPASAGRILVDGVPADGPLLGRAAWIAQRPRLFHGTLAENIALFDETLGQDRILAAAEAAGVLDFAASLPDGLDTRLGERGYALSGGQAQRVALARALAADMKLLLLDEPTAHLDGLSEARFLARLTEAARGRTVLIATHSPAVRAACDHVVELAPVAEGVS